MRNLGPFRLQVTKNGTMNLSRFYIHHKRLTMRS
jgi:hypothetical protein